MHERVNQIQPEAVAAYSTDGLHKIMYGSFRVILPDIIAQIRTGTGPFTEYIQAFDMLADHSAVFFDRQLRSELAKHRRSTMHGEWLAEVPNATFANPFSGTLHNFDTQLLLQDIGRIRPAGLDYKISDALSVRMIDVAPGLRGSGGRGMRLPYLLPVAEGFLWHEKARDAYFDVIRTFQEMFRVFDGIVVDVDIRPAEERIPAEYSYEQSYGLYDFIAEIVAHARFYDRFDKQNTLKGFELRSVEFNPRWFVLQKARWKRLYEKFEEHLAYPFATALTGHVPGCEPVTFAEIVETWIQTEVERTRRYERVLVTVSADKSCSVGQLISGRKGIDSPVNGVCSVALYEAQRRFDAFMDAQERLHNGIRSIVTLDTEGYRVLLSVLTLNEMGVAAYLLARKQEIQTLLEQKI